VQRQEQPLDECLLAVVQRGLLPIHALLIDVEPLEEHRARGEEAEADAREELKESGGGAFGVGDGGEVAGEKLAGETGDWGFFEAREDGGCGGAVAADEDDVSAALVYRAKASAMPSPMPDVPPTKTPTGV
jgi:hypothetical protein